MKLKSNLLRQEFNRFSTNMIHNPYPGIDLFQLEPGALQGWVFSAKVGPYYVNSGSFNRTILYEGTFNLGMMNVGFIFNQEHTAMVHAHEYDSGSMDINCGATSMYEVFPANMVWVGIYAPEKTMMDGIKYSKKKLYANPRLVIEGSRDDLIPLVEMLNACIHHSKGTQKKCNHCHKNHLKSLLHKLISSRLTEDVYEQPFVKGDIFRMRLLNKVNKLSLTNKTQPLSLDEICTAVNMKRRTVQKYFHEIYGMGPTRYFRIRRLNGARIDLMNGATSVSETALNWGFTHFGRFSQNYKTLFNESPTTTIELAR